MFSRWSRERHVAYHRPVEAGHRERLERERKRLVLAVADMKHVAVAAAHLAAYGREMNAHAEREMQTGLVVTYARSYVKSQRSSHGAIEGRLAKPEDPWLRDLHKGLLAARCDVFAVNDAAPWQRATFPIGRFHVPFGHPVYGAIEGLANAQRVLLQARLDEVERELAAG